MQIDDASQIPNISQRTGFSIFVFPRNFDFNQIKIENAYIVEPEKYERNASGTIKKEQIIDVLSIIGKHQVEPLTILFRPAEKMNSVVANAFLKSLEEPGENIHIVFFTYDLQQLLPTIRSRASIYYLKQDFNLDEAPNASKTDLELAKSLLTANTQQLIKIADKLQKNKENARATTLDILDIAIELAYKTYFKTCDEKWLKKLTQLTSTYDNIRQNGHIKLQIIANML